HNRREGDAEHEVVRTQAREPAVLRGQPVVGRLVDVEQVAQVRIVVGDSDEDAVARVARRDEAMRVELPDEGDAGAGPRPAGRASSSRRTVCRAGRPPLVRKVSGVAPEKIAFVFGSWIQASASDSE